MLEITIIEKRTKYPSQKKMSVSKETIICMQEKCTEAFELWHNSCSCYNCLNLNAKLKNRQKLNIPNFEFLPNKGARGESLSSKKNRHHLKELRGIGIDTIIDLRDKYSSESYPDLCKENNLKYYNIPIDSFEISDERIIKNLPLLFKLIDKGGYYIACAQGLHRTDIALSINYVFNPNSKEIPILYGHFRDGSLKFDDIARRLHSLKREMSYSDIEKIGWGQNFESEFYKRKNDLKNYNILYFNN